MANNFTTLDAPVPFKEIEEANENKTETPSKEYDDLIDTLPVMTYGPSKIRLYKDFWLQESILRGALTMQNNFQSRPTSDLFVCSYMKSGATWLKALVFAIMTRSSYSFDEHPLLTNNPHQCVASIHLQFAAGRSYLLEAIPSPRILSTHLPYSFLPESITSSDCRIIYIYRDPKDVLVSQYHFIYDVVNMGDQKPPFEEIFSKFSEGFSFYGPIWDHVLGYWSQSVIRPEKFLFLKYEDMLRDTVKHVKKIAEFIGHPFLEVEEKNGVVEQIVELCSFRKQKNLKVNKTTVPGLIDKEISYSAFFRKGEVGDWRNHMTLEMARKIDGITETKFKGSGLEIPMADRSSI